MQTQLDWEAAKLAHEYLPAVYVQSFTQLLYV